MAITHPICQKIQQFVNKFLSHSPDGHRHEDTLSKKVLKTTANFGGGNDDDDDDDDDALEKSDICYIKKSTRSTVVEREQIA